MLPAMDEVGKILVVIGALTTGVGVVLWKTGGLGFLKHLGYSRVKNKWDHSPLTF